MARVGFFVLLGLIFCAVCNGILPPPSGLTPVCPAFNPLVCLFSKPGPPQCSNDSGCTDSKKCCCSSLCGLMCLDPEIVKPLRCPNKPEECDEYVTDACNSDSDCYGHMKCCDMCGKECRDPVPESLAACPKIAEGQTVSLQCNLKTCTRDSDCEVGEKCCASENGPSCVKSITVNAGRCPDIEAKCPAKLTYKCVSDGDCSESEKCCDICGRNCWKAEKVNAGRCPDIKAKCLAELTYKCVSDGDCSESEKCCNICGRNCWEAKKD